MVEILKAKDLEKAGHDDFYTYYKVGGIWYFRSSGTHKSNKNALESTERTVEALRAKGCRAIAVEEQDGWLWVCYQAARCTSPLEEHCPNCPEQCRLDGIPAQE